MGEELPGNTQEHQPILDSHGDTHNVYF